MSSARYRMAGAIIHSGISKKFRLLWIQFLKSYAFYGINSIKCCFVWISQRKYVLLHHLNNEIKKMINRYLESIIGGRMGQGNSLIWSTSSRQDYYAEKLAGKA